MSLNKSDDYDALVKAFAESGVLAQTRKATAAELGQLPTSYGKIVVAVQGQTTVEGHTIELVIGLRLAFPSTVPVVFLKSMQWDILGIIPHVETNGYVCYVQEEGLLLDRRRPVDIMVEATREAISQLALGATRKNVADFADEFDAYWSRVSNSFPIRSFIDPSDSIKVIAAYVENEAYKLVCDTERDLTSYYSGCPYEHLTQRNAIYIPLPKGTIIIPPHPNIRWTPVEATKVILAALPEVKRTELFKAVRKLHKREELVILKLPRSSSEGSTLFGLLFSGVSDQHPLGGGAQSKKVTPVNIQRYDREYLIPRGGGNLTLSNKRVAIIGCGSLGGNVAFELARSGILNLTLVDNDILKPENIFRHVLGKSYLTNKKVEALKKDMCQKLPYLTVDIIPYKIEEAIYSQIFEPGKYDLIVVTLGIPSVELYLNERFAPRKKSAPPLLFAWLEAYGIGGHVLVTNNRDSKGCLECLYTPTTEDSDQSLFCRASFAKPNQRFGKNLVGCSGLFIPYGAITASQTAALAVQAAVDLLTGHEAGNPLLSFKGPCEQFLREGYQLADRYRLSSEQLFENRYSYANPRCLVCGGARE